MKYANDVPMINRNALCLQSVMIRLQRWQMIYFDTVRGYIHV